MIFLTPHCHVFSLSHAFKKNPMITNPLLSYGMYSFPSPMQINFNNACLNIAISPKNSENQVWCKKIVFSLPVGLNSNDLTNDPESIAISVSSNLWQVSSITSGGLVTMSPIHDAPQLMPKEGVNIQFSQINSNTANGSCRLAITEYTASSDLPDCSFSPKEKKLTLSKFPEGFWIGNFVSDKVNVLSGQSVTLSWNMSGVGNIEIIAPTPSGEQKNIPIEEGKTSWESGALRQTTAFELQASTGSSNDLQIFSLQTVVNVSDQKLVLDTLTVNKDTILQSTSAASISANTIHAISSVTAENLSAKIGTNTENLTVRESAFVKNLFFNNLSFNPNNTSGDSVSILDYSYNTIFPDLMNKNEQSCTVQSDSFLIIQGHSNGGGSGIITLTITISRSKTDDYITFPLTINLEIEDSTFACIPVSFRSTIEAKYPYSYYNYFQIYLVSMGNLANIN
ncbi:MAG: hypothetical protein MI784_12575 [Cytophagales bacterium]|nr:hypothetical protein [Cytophagales bacterium]